MNTHCIHASEKASCAGKPPRRPGAGGAVTPCLSQSGCQLCGCSCHWGEARPVEDPEQAEQYCP